MSLVSWVRLRLGLALALLLMGSASIVTAAITVSIVPANNTVYLNETNDPLVLAIEISNPDRLAVKSWSLDLYYDPGVFEPIASKGTVPLQGFELGSYIPGFSTMDSSVNWAPAYEHNLVAPDVARAGLLNFGTASGNATSGTLCWLAVDVIGLSSGSILSLGGDTTIYLSNMEEADATFNPAQITVLQTPEPASLMLLGLGVAAMVRRKR